MRNSTTQPPDLASELVATVAEQAPALRTKPQPGYGSLYGSPQLRQMVEDVRRRMAEGQDGMVIYTLHFHRGGVRRLGVAEVNPVDVAA